jgi:D-alanine-D-alanine ligase
MKKKQRIIVLIHAEFMPPSSISGMSWDQVKPFRTEYDVISNLREMGHEVLPLGVKADLGVIKQAADEFKPDVVFNLLEGFAGETIFDAHVVGYLELIKLRYTGCNPRGLMLARDKALSKMICRGHRIPVPQFFVVPVDRPARKPKRVTFPLIVKSLTEEGSVGISQASLVHDDDALQERVKFIHRTLQTQAIVEEYIDGRELYVGVIGNERLQTLPIWELDFGKLREDAPRIATGKLKWDYNYQEKIGLDSGPAQKLPEGSEKQIRHLCKRVYRALSLTGYARIDLRLSNDGVVYLIEANPNPQLAWGEDFAESAHAAGVDYHALLARILRLSLSYRGRGFA